jgi:hypothetical protein
VSERFHGSALGETLKRAGIGAIEERVAEWERAMRAYPSDGWDGAAALIAAHERDVRQIEAGLDRDHPGWRDRTLPFRPRTRRPV